MRIFPDTPAHSIGKYPSLISEFGRVSQALSSFIGARHHGGGHIHIIYIHIYIYVHICVYVHIIYIYMYFYAEVVRALNGSAKLVR